MIHAINSYLKYHNIHLTSQKLKSHNSQLTTVAIKLNKLIFVAKLKQIFMATLKIKFRPSAFQGKEGKIYYRITHNRQSCQITTDHHLFAKEWDGIRSKVIIPESCSERFEHVSKTAFNISSDIERLNNIIRQFKRDDLHYSSSEIAEMFLTSTKDMEMVDYMTFLIGRLNKSGRECTAKTYSTVKSSFSRFAKERHISLNDVTADLIMSFESYLINSGLCPNSTSYHMRNLRAIYNRAVEEGLAEQNFPFRRVYTGIAKTRKRAVPLRGIKKIKNLKLDNKPRLCFARDIFMLSFYTRGMSIIDMAYLKKTNLANGVLIYRRKKTGQTLTIKWEKQMQDIVSKYSVKSSPYLLPILNDESSDTRKIYRSKAQYINRNLKEVGKLAGLSIPLTLYVARHCWASVARSKNIPIAVISEGMGHDSEKTTQIYLAELDSSAVDKANNLIIKSL